ncbi:MAG TPA: OmpW family outer membrane protein [Steroidobacteraceae bacterium]|nr:OmpW family outer membrane protein [Steroidobacteraceae bacterium]
MIARIVGTACCLAVSFAASKALAEDALSNSVRIGAYYVTYHTTADDISGPYVPPGVNLELQHTFTPYLAYVRRLDRHFSVELALGVPPLTKTRGKGPAALGSVPYNGQVISTARWFAPTLLLQYNFLDESARLRPYIGAGINYVRFYDRRSTAAGNAASGGPTSISLPASVGPAGTVGLACRITRHFSVYASYSLSQVNSRLTANTAGVIRTSHIKFGPRAAVLSAGYSF